MKLYRLFILFLLFAVFQIQTFAADYLYKKLPSGQSVIIYEMKDSPIVTVNTWVKTGSINEDDTNTGVAHFLEHLFFKGSKNVPTGEFDKLLESKGAVTNAATSKDYTQFYITIPSKDFDLALKLHSDMLMNPLIPRKELEKERFVVLEEIARGVDNPSNVLYTNLFKLVYSTDNNHPYKRPVIGTKDVISSISREAIMDFYEKWYTPDNMITIISGDIDKNYALNEVEKAFAFEPKKQPKREYPAIEPINKQIKITEEKDVAQGYMAIAYKAPKFTNQKETYALDILAIILGGSNSSILNTELKERRQIVNSISASYSQYMDDGLFILSSTFAPEKLNAAESGIFAEIEKVKAGAITAEQVKKAKNMIKSSTYYSRESAANIANEIGYFALYFDTPKMYDDYLKQIDKVSVKDVIEAANKFLNSEKTAVSIVMPNNIKQISNLAPIAAAAKVVPDSAEVIERTKTETKYLLDNGATLIIRPNKQNSIIAFNIQAKGGTFIEPKPGTANLTSAAARRGTKSYSAEELNDYLDENGIKISLAAHADSFIISMLTTVNKLDEALKILDETVNHPTFSTTEIEKVKKDTRDYINNLKDRPLSLVMDKFTELAYKGYPYANNSKTMLKYIDEITRNDMISYYNSVLDSKNIVITVAGDVDPDKMIKTFSNIFEDKNQPKREIKDYLKASYIPSENTSFKLQGSDKETSWIILGYKTCPIYSIKEVAVLRVIDSLMGTGMSSRLFKSLRENQGLAYQVGSQISQYGNDGVYFAYIGTNSKNEQTAKEGILAEFNRLKTEFVSNKELQDTKDKLLGNMVIALETNMDRASFMTRYTSLGFDMNFLDTLKKEIENVTPSDILEFANKYFSNPYIEVTVGK